MHLLADSATWIAVGLAVGAAVVALALSAVVAVLATRTRRARQTDLEGVRASVSRTEAMVADLSSALEHARAESRRSRRLAEIASSIDLDEVLERTLAGGISLPGADAAMIVLAEDQGEPLYATLGMSAQEAARQPVAAPQSASARAVRIAYRYGEQDDAAEGGDEPIRGGIAVPLRDEQGEALGTFAAFWRRSGREASEEDLAELEEVAASAGPAIQNARRFREARQLADLDGLTNLHNRRYFHETLARECARAHRYERRLALVLLDIDGFKAINDRIGHLAGDAVLASVAERIQSVVRSADIACRTGGDEFAVLLPESSLGDAEQLYRRIQFAVGSSPISPADSVHVSAGLAELRPGDDPVSFFQRADEALYRAKDGIGPTGSGRDADSPGSAS